MKFIFFRVIAFLAFSAVPASAQLTLAGLEQLKPFKAMRASSSDLNLSGNDDSRSIEPNGSMVLADLKGPGKIAHIWMTISHKDPHYSRLMTLRIYWDGEKDPSVECPIGDFFGMGHGIDKSLTSIPIRVTSQGRARNCYWPMPFKKSARITVTNESDKRCDHLYYYIDWQKHESLPEDIGYFHAMYRQEYPCVAGRNYLIADIVGRGHYVGTIQSVQSSAPGWYGEGDDFFFIDGEKEPSLRGTGTEDYFCNGWGFEEQSGPFYGTPLWEGYKAGNRSTAYRFHVPDPISFEKSLRVEIEHKGSEEHPNGKTDWYVERDDLMSSVAFWYQVEPHKPWPALPPGPERLPFRERILLKGHEAVASAKHSKDPVEIQFLDGVTDGKQLWFKPTDDQGWLEVTFQVDKPQPAELFIKTVHSWDYGIYRLKLDGEEIGKLDLYSPGVTPTTEDLKTHRLEQGLHTLRFECVGKSAKSAGYFLGFDGLIEHIATYNRPLK